MSEPTRDLASACLRLLASLASDSGTPEAAENFLAQANDPAELHTAIYTLTFVSGAMLDTADGDTDVALRTFQIDTPFGRVPVESAPPELRWVARWLVAALNGDLNACMALWFTDVSEAEASATTSTLVPTMIALWRHSVRRFIDAGKPLSPETLARISNGGAR